jgi:transcriptional regulator GlxA family with amidase domain
LARSILQEIIRERLAHACQLLETTNLKIEDVAAAAGFPNRYSLHIAFLREKGVTPHKYRAALRR